MKSSRHFLMLTLPGAITVASAQIITDGSMGRVESFNGKFLTIDEIIGRTVGPNLFHSFEKFNVALGQKVTFSGGDQITRVITRVTGGDVSKIEGTLSSSIPGADFYLVNPAGIVFGPCAKVDVGGAFVATTADGLTMADGSKFQARLGGEDVLTVAPPASFGFLESGGPGAVSFDQSDLTVRSSKGFDVVARSIDVSHNSVLEVPEGGMRMVAVGGVGDLPVESLDPSAFGQMGQISIRDGSRIHVGEVSSGRFVAYAHDMFVDSKWTGSFEIPSINIENAGGDGVGESRIQLTGKLAMKGGGIRVQTQDDAPTSKLFIHSAEVELDNSWIVAETLGSAKGPDIEIHSPRVTLKEDGSIFARSTEDFVESPGAAGSVSIQGGTLEVVSGTIGSNNGGAGRGGDIRIDVDHFLMGGTTANAEINVGPDFVDGSTAPGPTGDIIVNTKEFTMGSSSIINTSPSDFGPSGNISVHADTFLLRDGAVLNTSVSEGGSSGFVDIHARSLRMENKAWIATGSLGSSNAGDITLSAFENVMISDSSIDSAAGWTGSEQAHGGTIRIHANGRLDIIGNSFVTADSAGTSKAGDIIMDADAIHLGTPDDPRGGPFISSGTDASARSEASHDGGEAGNISIKARVIEMNQALLVSDTSSTGDGGDVSLSSSSLVMRDTQVRASSDNAGRSGNVTICCGRVELDSGSYVTTESWGVANGGNIHIDASDLIITQGSTITTSSLANGLIGGKAGSISVKAQTVWIADSGSIDASSSGPVSGGDIQITTDTLLVQSPASGGLGTSSIITSTDGIGVGGTIKIVAGTVDLNGPKAEISAESMAFTQGAGSAGSVFITGGRVRLANGATVSSESFLSNAGSLSIVGTERLEADAAQLIVTAGSGDAGRISLISEGLLLVRNTGVEAVARGDGGNIRMIGLAVGLSDARILANAERGNGGVIDITTDLYLSRGLNRIEFDSQNEFARSGSFRLNTSFDLVSGLEALNGEMTSDAMEVREGCSRRNPRANSLMVRGKGGVPNAAAGLLPALFSLKP